MGGGLVPHLADEGIPEYRLAGLDGEPPFPHREIGRQSRYAAGGMPLAFTQEDFLGLIGVFTNSLREGKGDCWKGEVQVFGQRDRRPFPHPPRTLERSPKSAKQER